MYVKIKEDESYGDPKAAMHNPETELSFIERTHVVLIVSATAEFLKRMMPQCPASIMDQPDNVTIETDYRTLGRMLRDRKWEDPEGVEFERQLRDKLKNPEWLEMEQ